MPSSCPLLAGVGGEEHQPSYRSCGDQVSTPELQQGRSAVERWRGRLYTRAAACPDTTLVSDSQIQMGSALVTLCAVLSILSPHYDCGHTEVAPDPEIARVQEEVCSAEERTYCNVVTAMSSSPHLLTLLVTCYTAPLSW